MFMNEASGRLQPPIEIESGNDRFQGVGQQCRLLAKLITVFVITEMNGFVDAKAAGDISQCPAIDQPGKAAVEGSFRIFAIFFVESVRNNQSQNPVAQKLHPFIIAALFPRC